MEQSEPPETDHQLARGLKNRPGLERERLWVQNLSVRASRGVFAAGDDLEPAIGATAAFRFWRFSHTGLMLGWVAGSLKPSGTKEPVARIAVANLQAGRHTGKVRENGSGLTWPLKPNPCRRVPINQPVPRWKFPTGHWLGCKFSRRRPAQRDGPPGDACDLSNGGPGRCYRFRFPSG